MIHPCVQDRSFREETCTVQAQSHLFQQQVPLALVAALTGRDESVGEQEGAGLGDGLLSFQLQLIETF